MLFLLAASSATAHADDYIGGIPLTTVQTGTVTGDLWFDVNPAPNWGDHDVTKTFTLPAAAVAEPGRIQWARLYISAYCGHMQNDYTFHITNKFDGNGDGIYEYTWPEPNQAPFTFLNDGGNDNTAVGGGTNDPYRIINDHENRVTSDYLMYYNVTNLIQSQTVNVNVNTENTFDGRIKVISLIVAYDDPASTTQTTYWVNQGHDSCSYYTEDYLGYAAVGTTTFATTGLTNITSATLTIDYMASNNGYYGFPTADNNFECTGGTPPVTGTFTNVALDRTPDVEGPYSGVDSWNVTSSVTGSSDVTFAYARYFPATGISQFYKIPLAILVTKKPISPPIANFTTNKTSGIAPLTVKFTDQSTNYVTGWAWDFNNDGTIDSTMQNPVHTYDIPGNYTVNLSVTGQGGTGSKTALIIVKPPPVAGFTANVTEGYVPLTVQFNDTSLNEPTKWEWDFGDGNISDKQNPVHTYNGAGKYTVKLNVSSDGVSNTIVKTNLINASLPPVPEADFLASTVDGIMPLTVQFTDASRNYPSSWLWDFGDGNTSPEQNPSHVYTAPGHYNVSLTVTNAGGSDTRIIEDYIYVRHMVPAAGFTSDVRIGMNPLTVHFTDTSANTPSSWLWDFGDGNTSPEQNPSHVYTAPGHYNVSLTATNDGGSNITTRNDYITVTDRPVYSLSPSSLARTPGDDAVFDIFVDSLPDGLKKFGLNVTLESPGVASIDGVEYPEWAVAENSYIDGNTVHIEAGDPNDQITAGKTGVKLATVNLTSVSPGTTAIILSDPVLDDDLDASCTPITVNGSLSVYIPLNAVINANNTSGEIPLEVDFFGLSTGTPGPSSWHWDFGDGNTSNTKNATHTYTVPGKYRVSLTVENEYCTDNASITVNVTSQKPVANFTWDQARGPVPFTVHFTDTSTGNIDSWYWSFGDGNTSSDQNPTHTYVTPNGVNPPYTVTLTVENDGGNSTMTVHELIRADYPLPVAGFTANRTSGEPPLSIKFTDTSTNVNSWAWNFGDGNTSGEQNPSHTYWTAGKYTVNLTVTGLGGTDTEIKQNYITVGNQTNCDLTINGTVVPIPAFVFAREPNVIKIGNIKNIGSGQSPQTEVELKSSDGFVARATVPALAAGAQTNITIEDTTIRLQAGPSVPSVTYTATLDPDGDILETNEQNNQKSSPAKAVVYNGYKGKRYWDGKDDATVKTYDLRGGIVHSFGDSFYRSGAEGEWNSYTVKWTASDLPIPENATIRSARLYVPYTWDNTGVAPNGVHITFNGQNTQYENWYHDASNFGGFYDHVYGLLTYDVTSLYKKNQDNTALFTRDESRAKISMAGFTLAVVYEDMNATRKQIFINEEFDLLGASPASYGTNSAEATAYVPFTGMNIDTANVSQAYLTTFVPWGAAQIPGVPGEGNLIFNGNVLGTHVWDHGPTAGPQVAVDTRNVKQYIKSTDNVAEIQSDEDASTPCMAAIQEFLVIEYLTPGAEPDETLNETLAGTQSNASPSASVAPGTSGPGTGQSGPGANAQSVGGASQSSAILSLLLVVILAGASGAVLYYVINGKVVPTRVALPAVVAIILLLAAAGGFVAGQTTNGGGTADNSSAAGATAIKALFSVIPTIQDIQDEDTSNEAPDYPAGFEADNGILFVHEKGDPVKVGEISIRLECNGEETTIEPGDEMPAGRCTSGKVTGYIEEMGGGDGIVRSGEWLMLYADGCFEGADGKAVVWNNGGTPFIVYEGDRVDYTIMDSSGGVIDEGDFQFNP